MANKSRKATSRKKEREPASGVQRNPGITVNLDELLGDIHQGDCIEWMQRLPDGKIDLVFADPPFNIGFTYDQYQDNLDDDQYLAWSKDWISEVFRILRPDGTFWLAIGDEYAAELKVAAQSIGFHCRSWVIWYYTFGVNCRRKFTRSHAHLFHLVKDPSQFVFNHQDLQVRVPSARQLIYNDKRANAQGRMPDDTWILRPQDLVDGISPDEDVWYFSRVAGTFHERAGFHGCQMPEQLLGRIIRTCSNPDDIVLDPFSGSATTVSVAKKLGRRFLAFELSPEYVKFGRQRLARIDPQDELDGAPEPNMKAWLDQAEASGKFTKRARKSGAVEHAGPDPVVEDHGGFDVDPANMQQRMLEHLEDYLRGFAEVGKGFSLDRLVVDPILNEDFQLVCDRKSLPGTPAERNRFLFRMRKAGELKKRDIHTSMPTRIEWSDIDPLLSASEIAWRQMQDRYEISLDEIICDPRLAVGFDRIAEGFAPGFSALEYRWAALKLRKESAAAKRRAERFSAGELGVAGFEEKSIRKLDAVGLNDFDAEGVPNERGIFVILDDEGRVWYAGEADRLAGRLKRMFGDPDARSRWLAQARNPRIVLKTFGLSMDCRFARQFMLVRWHQPRWNLSSE